LKSPVRTTLIFLSFTIILLRAFTMALVFSRSFGKYIVIRYIS
jgi:hypothetical protein